MKWLCRNFVPSRIAGQITILVVISLIITYSIMAGVFIYRSHINHFPEAAINIAKFGYTAKLLASVRDGEARREVLKAAGQALPDLRYAEPHSNMPPDSFHPGSPFDELLASELGSGFHISSGNPHFGSDGDQRLTLSIGLPDESSITASFPNWHERGMGVLVGTLALLGSTLSLLIFWSTKGLTAPLRRFADAADQFSIDGSNDDLPDQGPLEIRTVAHALNNLRARIRGLVEDRICMLAAIGHDLRTPITRLVLRTEDIADESVRFRFIRDLQMMSRMVDSALALLRERSVHSRMMATDLPSLLQTICDDFADMGRQIEYIGPLHECVTCDPDQISRAVTNLVGNALKFGKSAAVRLHRSGPITIEIEVEDDGPGISDADKERVFEPFYRTDAARQSGESAGFGLGLSIARTIAERHGGRIVLADASPSGIIARLTLPVSSDSPVCLPGVRSRTPGVNPRIPGLNRSPAA
jgi:signal transduction histidine kinase